MEINVRFSGQSAANGLADHGLVIHQQDHEMIRR
jgi:hypothetical protein